MTFPGTGRIIGHVLGHPEPVTLPLTFPALRDSLNLMNMPEAIISTLAMLWRTATSANTALAPEACMPVKPFFERLAATW
ncbi:MAG: hypothetical protein GDA49_02170 [Rhodospirillales bacterium]|nr:hypothetical protein [Rhodospirillales bacterium]